LSRDVSRGRMRRQGITKLKALGIGRKGAVYLHRTCARGEILILVDRNEYDLHLIRRTGEIHPNPPGLWARDDPRRVGFQDFQNPDDPRAQIIFTLEILYLDPDREIGFHCTEHKVPIRVNAIFTEGARRRARFLLKPLNRLVDTGGDIRQTLIRRDIRTGGVRAGRRCFGPGRSDRDWGRCAVFRWGGCTRLSQ
jgi:hypothetical protein